DRFGAVGALAGAGERALDGEQPARRGPVAARLGGGDLPARLVGGAAVRGDALPRFAVGGDGAAALEPAARVLVVHRGVRDRAPGTGPDDAAAGDSGADRPGPAGDRQVDRERDRAPGEQLPARAGVVVDLAGSAPRVRRAPRTGSWTVSGTMRSCSPRGVPLTARGW